MRKIWIGLVIVVLTAAGCGFHISRSPSCNLKEKVLAVVLSTQRFDRLVRVWVSAVSVTPEIAWADAEAEVSLNSFYYLCGDQITATETGVVDAAVKLRGSDLAALRGSAADPDADRQQLQQAVVLYLQAGKAPRPKDG